MEQEKLTREVKTKKTAEEADQLSWSVQSLEKSLR